jgi:hypothetical protein
MIRHVTWAGLWMARSSFVLAFVGLSGMASAQSDKPWDGTYAGLNVGGSSNGICQTWTANGAGVGPAVVGAFGNRHFSNGETFAGGFQIGNNVQYQHLFLGLGLEFDVGKAESQTDTVKSTGGALPAGSYTFTERLSPDGFVTLGPRIGFPGGHPTSSTCGRVKLLHPDAVNRRRSAPS